MSGDRKPRNFVVVPKSMGRCGSTWLCQLLDSHPDIACLNEPFNPRSVGEDRELRSRVGDDWAPADVYREIGVRRGPASWRGFKTFPQHLDPERFEALVRFVDRIVLIDRRNLTRAVASEMLARSTGSWHPKGWLAVLRARRRKIVIPIASARQRLRSAVQGAERLVELIRAAGTAFTEVCYEDLVADAEVEMGRVFAELGLRGAAIRARTRRVHTDGSFVSNVDEIDRELGATYGYLRDR